MADVWIPTGMQVLKPAPLLLARNVLLAFAVAGILGLGGCEGIGADTPRAAWERAMKSYAERDYGTL